MKQSVIIIIFIDHCDLC